jgi:hypothetical protein
VYYTGDASIILPDGGDTLPLPQPSQGVSYEIYVDNSLALANTAHDELEEYYKVLRKDRDDSGTTFPVGEQFRLELPHLPPDFAGSAKVDTNIASARIPCQSIVLEG